MMRVSAEAKPYLDTFRRIPAEPFLRLCTREFEMLSSVACVCGWAIREALSNSVPAENISPVDGITIPLSKHYGGSPAEWQDIYYSVMQSERLDDIEEAFTARWIEAAESLEG